MKIKNIKLNLVFIIMMVLAFSSCQKEEVLVQEIPENAINLDSTLVDLIIQVTSDGADGNNFINCLDFVYPITISVYNTDTEQTDVVIFNNDEELFLFFSNMNEYDLVVLDFPLTVILYNTFYIVVENDEELAVLISECEEINPISLTQILIEGVWFIDFYFEGETDQTEEFCEFRLNFDEDGQVVASNGVESISGSWTIDFVEDEIVVIFDFEANSVFEQVNDTWFVINANPDVVAFEIPQGSDGLDIIILDREETDC